MIFQQFGLWSIKKLIKNWNVYNIFMFIWKNSYVYCLFNEWKCIFECLPCCGCLWWVRCTRSQAKRTDTFRALHLISGFERSINDHLGIFWCQSDNTSFVLHICHTCSLGRVKLVPQFPARDRLKSFFLVVVLVFTHIRCPAFIFTCFLVFIAGTASQEEEADFSRIHSVPSGFQESDWLGFLKFSLISYNSDRPIRDKVM